MTELAQTQGVGSEPLRLPRFQEAFRRVLPKLETLGDELEVVNLDIPTAVTTVLGIASEIRKLREQCALDLPRADLTLFDEIETQALAMAYAHSRHKAASTPTLPVQELSDQVVAKRELFAADCTALAARQLIDGERLRELKGTVGYKNQAFDLLMLIALMRESWQRITGKTAVTLAELDQAETLADQLLTALGEREQLPVAKEASADTRRRAYTLFVRSYDQLRRAAVYLRWDEGDADEFVPSLYAGKKRASELPVAPVSATAEQAAASPVAPAPITGASAVPVGMPNSDPFASKN